MLSKLFLSAILLWLTACSSTAYLNQLSHLQNTSEAAVLLNDVPFIKQRTKHCGPASLASVMRSLGNKVNPNELATQLYIEARAGSLQKDLLGAARRNGFLAYEHEGKLQALVQQLQVGVPVIVLQNLATSWAPVWHYSVVVGYDKNKELIYLHDGYEANKAVNFKYFEYTWRLADYWAVSLHQAGEIPEGATENNYVYAAHGLELAGQKQPALLAYQSASKRWPNNFIAWMGQGNIHYQLNSYSSAVTAYREACKAKPESAEAFHNLAWALLRNSNKQAALVEINKAVEISAAVEHESSAMYRAAKEKIKNSM